MVLLWHSLCDTLQRMGAADLNVVEIVLCGILLASFLAYSAKAPPSTNDYRLKDCVSSEGPGPQNRLCHFCLDPISPSALSIKHKPCCKTFHLACFTEWKRASVSNLNTPLCPICLGAVLTYEQTLQMFLLRYAQHQKRFIWRLYLNAVVCGDWFAMSAAAIVIAITILLLSACSGLGQHKRWMLLRLNWAVSSTLG